LSNSWTVAVTVTFLRKMFLSLVKIPSASTPNTLSASSTSIRDEHDGFMRIHKKRGFRVNGSYAYIRTEDGMKGLK